MKLLLALILLVSLRTYAATLAVLPGESIQSKVDAAAPGDIVAVFGGSYPGDVTVNKAIRLVEVDGQDVTITGSLTFTNIVDAPPFEGFAVGSAGKGILVQATTGLTIKNVDTRAGAGLSVTGASKVAVIGGNHSVIQQDGGELTANQVTITGDMNATSNAAKTVAFRVGLGGNFNWSSKKAWIGYSTAKGFTCSGTGCQIVIVGCTFDRQQQDYARQITLEGSNNKLTLLNTVAKGSVYASVYYSDFPARVDSYGGASVYIGPQNSAVIQNNLFIGSSQTSGSAPTYGNFSGGNNQAVGVYSATPSCIVENNIVIGWWFGLTLPYGAVARNNHFFNVQGLAQGGVVPTNITVGNPLLVSGQDRALQPTSPCINAGVNDPIYNDLDGSTNDIGPGGGALFDPSGWTTNNPVVIAFDLSPTQLLKGVDTQVIISGGRAVSQP